MEILFSSFFACSISLTLLIGILYLLLFHNYILSKFGIVCIYVFALFIILRGYLPLDFHSIHLTKSFYSDGLLLDLQYMFNTTLFSIKTFAITPKVIFTIIWISGTFFYLFKRITGYLFYSNYLNHIKSTVSVEIQTAFDETYYSIFPHGKNRCRIIISDNLGTPAIFGLRNPIIILPDIYAKEDLKYVFEHELLHLKHKDFIIKFLADIVTALYWWNPLLLHFLFPLLNQTQELFVDYSLTQNLSQQDKTEYLECISKSLKYLNNRQKNRMNVYALADGHSRSRMIQRLNCIIHGNVKGGSIFSLSFIAVLFILSFSFVLEPVYFPKYDEDGDKVYYYDENNSYYIKNGHEFDLYLGGEFVYTTSSIVDEFKNFPIYESEDDIKQHEK